MFWGDRMGNLTDPFGHNWAIATHKEDVSPEEMEKRMTGDGVSHGAWFPGCPVPEEGRRRSYERRGLISEDRSVATVRHDPQRRIRNPAKQFDGLLDRVKRIAIAVHDHRPRGDRRQCCCGEVHVFAIVGELARVAPERANLIVAEVMPPRISAHSAGDRPSSVIVRMMARAWSGNRGVPLT